MMKRSSNQQPNDDGKLDVHPIIRQIINRDCHVGESNRKVIRHVVSKLRNGYRTFRGMQKEERKAFMRQCIQQHRENCELYRAVMVPTYRDSSEEGEA
jgi:hypothetical protein